MGGSLDSWEARWIRLTRSQRRRRTATRSGRVVYARDASMQCSETTCPPSPLAPKVSTRFLAACADFGRIPQRQSSALLLKALETKEKGEALNSPPLGKGGQGGSQNLHLKAVKFAHEDIRAGALLPWVVTSRQTPQPPLAKGGERGAFRPKVWWKQPLGLRAKPHYGLNDYGAIEPDL